MGLLMVNGGIDLSEDDGRGGRGDGVENWCRIRYPYSSFVYV